MSRWSSSHPLHVCHYVDKITNIQETGRPGYGKCNNPQRETCVWFGVIKVTWDAGNALVTFAKVHFQGVLVDWVIFMVIWQLLLSRVTYIAFKVLTSTILVSYGWLLAGPNQNLWYMIYVICCRNKLYMMYDMICEIWCMTSEIWYMRYN